MAQPNSGQGFSGQARPSDLYGEHNALHFMIKTILATVAGATLVQVKSVTNSGGLSPVGFVNIQPLVNQMDGNWNAIPHGVIYQCPYFRLQGGANAIILDPQVNDIGIAIFADRDISSVAANATTIQTGGLPNGTPGVNPGSRRMYDMADGLYIGGVLNAVPVQFIQFTSTGVNITTPTLTLNGNLTVNGNILATGQVNADVDVVTNGISLKVHVHGGVQGGSSYTEEPSG